MRQGQILVSWEIKEDGIVAAVEFPPETLCLPYEFRQRIVQRVRETLLPPRGERKRQIQEGREDVKS